MQGRQLMAAFFISLFSAHTDRYKTANEQAAV